MTAHSPIPGVLNDREMLGVQQAFGVSEVQVRRDHVISHILAAISDGGADGVVFFGGTALSRTHLNGLRLSEDIDLIATADRTQVAERTESAVVRSLRRSLGLATFSPSLRSTKGPEAAVVSVANLRVQIQLLSAHGYPRWPTEVREIEQRYSDVPPARLQVLTQPAFAAAKLSAWHDRHASRDLYDMWGMAVRGMINREAVELFENLGPLTRTSEVSFDRVPTSAKWHDDLAHQCAPQVTAAEAVEIVRDVWKHA